MRWLACIVGVLALFVTNAAAQDTPVQRVEIQVLSVDADTVRVDRGRSAGIQSGDRVRIFAAGLPTIEGTVQSVREDSCRVEIPSGTIGIDPGTSGEVLVPVDRDAAVDLPWTAPSEDFDPNSPLLLGQATPSSEREPAWGGRSYKGNGPVPAEPAPVTTTSPTWVSTSCTRTRSHAAGACT